MCAKPVSNGTTSRNAKSTCTPVTTTRSSPVSSSRLRSKRSSGVSSRPSSLCAAPRPSSLCAGFSLTGFSPLHGPYARCQPCPTRPEPRLPLPLVVGVELAAVLVVCIGILTARVPLLRGASMVKDRVGRLLVAVGGVFDQGLRCQLEALGLSAARLGNGALGGVGVLLAGRAADVGGFRGGALHLFPFEAGLGHGL